MKTYQKLSPDQDIFDLNKDNEELTKSLNEVRIALIHVLCQHRHQFSTNTKEIVESAINIAEKR